MGKNTTCKLDGCDLIEASLGWCMKHYTRNRRYGHPEKLSHRRGRTAIQRFNEYTKLSPHGCLEWQGGLLTNGYGSFRFENKSWPAHRWIWTYTHGTIPAGMVVRHKCDNPPCANIEHLELGTPQDNSSDCAARGRSAFGAWNAQAVLTEHSVTEILLALKAGKRTGAEIAEEYGVTPGAISHISTGRSWKHVPRP